MFGIGSTELLVILLVALIVLGPKSLAKVSRSLGKAMGEFRRVSTDFQRTLNAESAEADLREQEARRRKEAAASAEKAPPADPAPDAAATRADPQPETEDADSLTPPEGSPLAEALAKARAEAEAPPDGGAAASPTPPPDGPRA